MMKNPFHVLQDRFARGRGSRPAKDDDGRDQWQSRTAYVLASMGGAVGFGNFLRFPSQVFNNNGFQWFIPYFMSLGLVVIPTLILEVSIGASFRGGPIVSFNALSKRARGAGLGNLLVSLLVVVYYVPMLAYVLRFFRASFQSPLPWEGRLGDFWNNDVLRQVTPTPATYQEALEQETYMSYSGASIIGEQVGWTALSWLMVWLCISKGVTVTGKVVYVTMGLPIIVLIVLLIRGVTLPNAVDGIRLYAGEFNGEQLAQGQIWQAALGQVFYSTGVGFGYFTAYASYNALNANAPADAIIIACSNSLFEITAGFAVFGIVGFLGITPETQGVVESFTLGFITIPEGLASMPGAQVWSVIFFGTLFILGLSSSFVLLDVAVTVICDTTWGQKFPRIYVTITTTVIAFLLSLMYNTGFGYSLLNGIDLNTNNIVLPVTVFMECFSATVIYRCRDVFGQVGIPAFAAHQFGFVGGLVLGLVTAHVVSAGVGLGVGFGIYVAAVLISVLIAKTPDTRAPGLWGKNQFLCRLWWLALYSGDQLRHDLNVTLDASNAWPLPWFWHICLRYITCPLVAIVLSFGYPVFQERRYDPLQIFAFIVAHIALLMIIGTLVLPRWVDALVPCERLIEGSHMYAPRVTMGAEEIRVTAGVEVGQSGSSAEAFGKSTGDEKATTI